MAAVSMRGEKTSQVSRRPGTIRLGSSAGFEMGAPVLSR